MRIKEVCRTCSLTKKAVEYYEQQGLIKPQVAQNGYRDYRREDVDRLKEISVLRRFEIPIADIRIILDSPDRSSALARYRHMRAIHMQREIQTQARMDAFIRDYDVARFFEATEREDARTDTIREKLVMAFPGKYGIFLSLHFGSFLNRPIETAEQQAAYADMLAYLDEVPTAIPDELCGYLEEVFRSISYDRLEDLHANQSKALADMMADPEAYLRENPIEEYLQVRLSDEYRASPAGRMAELMAEFQRNSGYQERFIANMKVLSPDYHTYMTRMEAANEKLLECCPQAGRIVPEA